MDFQFIYVFSKHERDDLLERQYALLQSDEASDVYVFLNDPSKPMMFDAKTCVFSNVLSL